MTTPRSPAKQVALRLLKSARNVSLGVIGSLALLLCLLYFNQERIIFFPEPLKADFRFRYSDRFQEGYLPLSSGKRINYLVFNARSNDGNILYFHGNAGSLREWGFTAEKLAKETQLRVWIMDFPGFGKSTGPLPRSERELFEMAQNFCAEISRQSPNRPLILFGRSIGSGMASQAASKCTADALILETPFRSIAKLGHEMYPFLPESFSSFDLDNEAGITSFSGRPILILHGTADSVIPYTHGRHLSTLSPQVSFMPIQGGDHNNLSQYPEYWSTLKSFTEKIKKH